MAMLEVGDTFLYLGLEWSIDEEVDQYFKCSAFGYKERILNNDWMYYQIRNSKVVLLPRRRKDEQQQLTKNAATVRGPDRYRVDSGKTTD